MTDDQFEVLAGLLIEIRDVLTAGIQQADDETGDECVHPDDARVSLATLADPEHWICSACKYEHKGLTRN